MKLVIDISDYNAEWIRNAYSIPQEINTNIAESIINAEPYSDWIPVTEKLPKESGVYTVTDSKGDVVRFVFVTGSDSSRKYWYRCAKAWMPLPEPYKGVTT